MGSRMKGYVAVSLVLAILAGCGDGSDRGAKSSTAPASSPAKGASAQHDLAPRYKAGLAEGIDFRRDGWPEFVADVSGISVREPFGRWTDATRATITMAQPLPREFTLAITATQRVDKPIVVVVGDVRKEITFGKLWTFTTATLPLSTDGAARTITFEIADVKSPKELGEGQEARRAGLALATLKIQ